MLPSRQTFVARKGAYFYAFPHKINISRKKLSHYNNI